MFFGSSPNKLSKNKRALSKYSVGAQEPGLAFDFVDNVYQKDQNKTTNFSGAITHSRSGNAVMTDGYGPELVVNGGFDSDSDWTKGSGWSIADGKATNDGTINAIYLPKAIEEGKVYACTVDITFHSAGVANWRLGNTTNLGVMSVDAKSYTQYLVGSADGNYIGIFTNTSITIDNISVREMPVLKWAPHNLIINSEDFTSGYTNPNVTLTSGITDPTGGTDAFTLTSTALNAYLRPSSTITVKAGVTYTLRAFHKNLSGTASIGAYDASNLAVIGTQSITNTSSDWALTEYTFTTPSGCTAIYVYAANNMSNGATVDAFGLHLYRSDLGGMAGNPDQPPSRASYVPTTSSAVYLPRVGHHVYNGSAWVNEGLLAESESRTNLLSKSIVDDTWVRDGVTVSENDIVSPDGTQNATKIIEKATTGIHGVYLNNPVISHTSGIPYTMSAVVKKGTREIVQLLGSSTTFGSTVYANFDLSDGTIGSKGPSVTSATIQPLGNDWYRCSITANAGVTATSASGLVFSVTSKTSARAESFAGSTSNYFYVYHNQTEQASTPSSLIPTSGSSVTRPAETFTIPSANLPWPEPNYIGSQLVTNGTFDTDLNGWTEQNQTTATVVNGEVQVTGDGGYDDRINQTISTEVGKVYKVTATLRKISASARIGIRRASSPFSDITASTVSSTSNTDVELFFVADQTSFNVQLYSYTAGAGTAAFDNISVREIDPLSVSIAMDGRVTYADENTFANVRPYQWVKDGSNLIDLVISTDTTNTGLPYFRQYESGTGELVTGSPSSYSPDILVPFDVAARHGSTFINGALEGVALTEDTTPTALADLSAQDLNLAQIYMGTIGTFRVWDRDITDDGLVEATNPSLEPSLSLTFEGTGTNSFIVNDWSE